MCCIFTCCGWMIDLIQRLWTFTMSCCISSAVCCALVTASMSGIALGYNYSLAEYIDLKETNVSVYLKRGVFDDEIADDMDWRRSGHMPVEGHLRDSNLMTAPPDNEEMPLRAGRRMDDSVVVSDDQHKFEGSLMRLTVKPPAYSSSIEPVTSDSKMADIHMQYPKDSIEQIKAIHSLLNERRANTQRNTKTTESNIATAPDFNGRRLGGIAPGGVPIYHGPYSNEAPYHINQARLAVPESSIGRPDNWFLPKNKIPETYRRTMGIDDFSNVPPKQYTFPTAIIFTADMKRPTRPTAPPTRSTPVSFLPKDILHEGADPEILKNLPEDEVQIFKAQLLQDKNNLERLRNERLRQRGEKMFQSEDDYAEQANKGIQIRTKRALDAIYNTKINTAIKDDEEDDKDHDDMNGKHVSHNNVNDTEPIALKINQEIDSERKATGNSTNKNIRSELNKRSSYKTTQITDVSYSVPIVSRKPMNDTKRLNSTFAENILSKLYTKLREIGAKSPNNDTPSNSTGNTSILKLLIAALT